MSYLAESKRLDNRRLREELGVRLQYPDLPAGLEACAAVTSQTRMDRKSQEPTRP
jgi:hypothetical protein